jgi:hypothetical protein
MAIENEDTTDPQGKVITWGELREQHSQLQRQVKLLELSNNALSSVLASQKALARKRLNKMKALKVQLAAAKQLLAAATGDEPT